MGKIVNYGSLSKLAKKKVKEAGFTPSADQTSASRTTPSTRKSNKRSVTSSQAKNMSIMPANVIPDYTSFVTQDTSSNKQSINTSKKSLISTASNIQGEIDLADRPGEQFGRVGEVASSFVSGLTGQIQNRDLESLPTPELIGTLAGYMTGTYLLGAGITSAVDMIAAKTAIQQAAKIGTIGLYDYTVTSLGTAGTYAVNAATETATASWLVKLASAVTNPTFVVGTIMAAIGTYPFAGFIKEEALQTTSFTFRSAMDNNDLEAAEEALSLQEEMLDPGIWNQIKAKIPFVNVLNRLNQYYEAAKINLSLDRKILADTKIQTELGESEDDKWTRLRAEEAAQDKFAIDYYNQERKKMLDWEREAAIQARNEDAAFWAAQSKKQAELEAKERQAIADFWFNYRKRIQELSDASRPSNLNFGLL